MATTIISIRVDADSARIFAAATTEDRQKLQFLLSLRLRELTMKPTRSLEAIMDEIGRHAEAQGLTEKSLEQLLGES